VGIEIGVGEQSGLSSTAASGKKPRFDVSELAEDAPEAFVQRNERGVLVERIQRAGESFHEAIAMARTLRGGGPKRDSARRLDRIPRELVEQVHETDVRRATIEHEQHAALGIGFPPDRVSLSPCLATHPALRGRPDASCGLRIHGLFRAWASPVRVVV
jgi:hypothetical protein